jgi:hypothetical protein
VHQQGGQLDQRAETAAEVGTADESGVRAVRRIARLISRNRAREIVASRARSISEVGIVEQLLEFVPRRRSVLQGFCRGFRLEKELRGQKVDRSVANYIAAWASDTGSATEIGRLLSHCGRRRQRYDEGCQEQHNQA